MVRKTAGLLYILLVHVWCVGAFLHEYLNEKLRTYKNFVHTAFFNATIYVFFIPYIKNFIIILTFCAYDCVVVGIDIDAELESDGKSCNIRV